MALKNKRNIEGKATQRKIVKLRSEVSKLQFDCREKEKSFKILEKDFIESWTKVQAISEKKNKLKKTMGKKYWSSKLQMLRRISASHYSKLN
jgi:predicted  nucleic acid-binding Zn-ribbon protein